MQKLLIQKKKNEKDAKAKFLVDVHFKTRKPLINTLHSLSPQLAFKHMSPEQYFLGTSHSIQESAA